MQDALLTNARLTPNPAVVHNETPPNVHAVLDLDAPAAAEQVDLESVTLFVESPSSTAGSKCSECGFRITDPEAQTCDACGHPAQAPAVKTITAVNVPVSSVPPGSWSCSKCTLLNAVQSKWCSACEAARPVVHTRPPAFPHQVLAEKAYLDLVLFDYYAGTAVRAKVHGRFQLVCKAWQVICWCSAHPTLSACFRTLSARFRTLSARFRTLSACFRTLGARFRTLTACFHTLSARFRTLSARFRTLSACFRTLTARFRTLTARFRTLRSACIRTLSARFRTLSACIRTLSACFCTRLTKTLSGPNTLLRRRRTSNGPCYTSDCRMETCCLCRWRYGLLDLVPAVREFQNTQVSSNPFRKHKVLCCKLSHFRYGLLMLSLAGLIIMVVLVANAQDGGYFNGKSPYLTTLPFMVVFLGLLCPWSIAQLDSAVL